MKSYCLIIFFILYSSLSFAQNENTIVGKTIDIKSQLPLENVIVTIQNTNKMVLSQSGGKFQIKSDLIGYQLVLFRNQGYKEKLLSVELINGETIDLGTILLEEDFETSEQATVITINDNDLNEDNGSLESTSGMLVASKDAFQQAASYNWGQVRFRMRGLDSQYSKQMINGFVMNKMYDSRPQWGAFSGINNLLQNQETAIGNTPSDFSFGGLLGAQNSNTRASTYKKGTRISLSGTNTNYTSRSMFTYASGLNQKGWALVFSIGKSYAKEGYFEGTTYDATSCFLSIEKKLGDRNSINFTGFLTPKKQGKNSPNTDEVKALTSTKYNSYWGYQNGVKRNSRIKTIEEPALMINDYFKINSTTQLSMGLLYQFGKISNTNLDYQNANNPLATYYKNMPSYYSSLYVKDNGEFSGAFTPDLLNAELSKQNFLEHPQINWEAMYQANQTPILNKYGKIMGYEPAQSKYILYEDRTDDKTLGINTLLNSELNENIRMNVGATLNKLHSHNYQKVVDLLGGLYYEDIDVFYKGNQAQSDLNQPNRQVKEGDIYGYNYNFIATNFNAFTQFQFQYKKIDFYLSQEFSTSNYQREGLYKNGIYPMNSLGISPKVSFDNYGFKGGLTWKISGKELVNIGGLYSTKAPSLKAVYPNPRINNSTVADIDSEKNSNFEVNYIYRTPKWKMRLTNYFSEIRNATETSYFYAEGIFDDGSGTTSTNGFVSQTLTQIDKKNWGTELSFEYAINPNLKTTLAGSFGQYIYANNPNVTITNDAKASAENTLPIYDFGKALLKNYHQSGTPQQAFSIGFEYRNPSYWWIGTNVNYFDDRYIDISPIARTSKFFTNPVSGFPFPEATEEQGKLLLKQEKLPKLLVLNVVGGKSWRIFKKNSIVFFSVNNILNTSYKTGGYEQARNANFRQRNQDVSSGTPNFGNNYFWGYGRTYLLSLSIQL